MRGEQQPEVKGGKVKEDMSRGGGGERGGQAPGFRAAAVEE